MANKKIHHGRTMSRDALAINIVGYLLIGIFGLLCVIPFYLIIVASFTSEASLIRNGYPLIPSDFSVQSYLLCLKNPLSILKAYGTTIGVTMAGTLISVFIATMTGYVLSRKDFPWRNQLSFFFFFTTLFSGGLVPLYLQVRRLNLLNTLWSLILPVCISTYNLIIMRNFFQGVPDALYEAAVLDGASVTTYLWRILLPLSTSAIATITLFYAVDYWNAYYYALIFITKKTVWPMQALLRQIIMSSELDSLMYDDGIQNIASEMLKDAMIVVTALPIICVYPFLQRYFVKGVMVGSLKG